MGATRCFANFVNNTCTNKKTNNKCTNAYCNDKRVEIGAKVDFTMQVFDTPWNASEMNCDGAGAGGVGKCDR